ncbi:hypothetical protein YB2330_001477 [Saitoella coloradoensis]
MDYHTSDKHEITHIESIGNEPALAEIVQTYKQSAWTWSLIKLYLILSVSFLCSALNGYDGSLMGAINAMTEYQKYFGMTQAGSSTGIVFAIYNLGCLPAVVLVGPIIDRYGRRSGMFIGSFLVIIATCLQAPSTSKGMFMGGRFILGTGVAFCATSAPTYVSELAHPKFRGTQLGLYNTMWYVGSIIASWVAYATAFLPDNRAWRVPLWCQMITSGVVCAFVWFLPESPRWLVAHNRHEEAAKILGKYHGEGDINHPLVTMQMQEMETQIRSSTSDTAWWDYRELFSTKSARARLICVAGMAWFGQYSGNAVVSYFFPFMVSSAGISDPHTQLLLNGLNPVVGWIFSVCGAWSSDRVGRRPLLLYTLGCAIVIFAVITACTHYAIVDGNTGASYTAIVFVYLFSAIFSFGWTPLQAGYIVECLPMETRANGNALGQLISNIASAVGSYSGSAAMGSIGYWYYLVFVFWDMIEWTVIYFFFVETKGRTLEELNEVFEAANPVKKSLEPRSVEDVEHTIGGKI